MKTSVRGLFRAVFYALMLAGAAFTPAAGSETATATPAANAAPVAEAPDRIAFEVTWDAYYTSADLILSLTDAPIPRVGEKSEYEVYRDLLKSSLVPRFLLLEASVNPMPCLGGLIKKHAREFYDDSEVIDGLNLVNAVTAGFDEPYAFSVFAGNVVQFEKKGEPGKAGNNGYMGFLFSVGDYHIKDNDFIHDQWYEIEWKLKGDRIFSDQKLTWSFRLGGKVHEHADISDAIYVSLRRSRLDYDAPASSILKNSGFEYTFHVTADRFQPISHYLSLEKKWPLKNRKFAFSMAVGGVWETSRKYTGSLSRNKSSDFQLFIRPNIEF
ncbi:hypothetical protein [Desulfosudis oleivorans]|uniref:Uncharacterized protein n=1 Tax=Desulfosudis oleivorans (strain DSM 6200 / JCM 39069 / Hxd3) TaxID=96561 RepID=A8ZWU2_DESOH|nr:hypothetical protein [Desulfosudis oleivorans]ABW68423.1 hypothetical protein Dole_2620 [Desulfosudis oleivorans Hxd3]